MKVSCRWYQFNQRDYTNFFGVNIYFPPERIKAELRASK
jgi:hypothetical protein